MDALNKTILASSLLLCLSTMSCKQATVMYSDQKVFRDPSMNSEVVETIKKGSRIKTFKIRIHGKEYVSKTDGEDGRYYQIRDIKTLKEGFIRVEGPGAEYGWEVPLFGSRGKDGNAPHSKPLLNRINDAFSGIEKSISSLLSAKIERMDVRINIPRIRVEGRCFDLLDDNSNFTREASDYIINIGDGNPEWYVCGKINSCAFNYFNPTIDADVCIITDKDFKDRYKNATLWLSGVSRKLEFNPFNKPVLDLKEQKEIKCNGLYYDEFNYKGEIKGLELKCNSNDAPLNLTSGIYSSY